MMLGSIFVHLQPSCVHAGPSLNNKGSVQICWDVPVNYQRANGSADLKPHSAEAFSCLKGITGDYVHKLFIIVSWHMTKTQKSLSKTLPSPTTHRHTNTTINFDFDVCFHGAALGPVCLH